MVHVIVIVIAIIIVIVIIIAIVIVIIVIIVIVVVIVIVVRTSLLLVGRQDGVHVLQRKIDIQGTIAKVPWILKILPDPTYHADWEV